MKSFIFKYDKTSAFAQPQCSAYAWNTLNFFRAGKIVNKDRNLININLFKMSRRKVKKNNILTNNSLSKVFIIKSK